VTVIGGLEANADMIANDTEKQEAALEVLLQVISDTLNVLQGDVLKAGVEVLLHFNNCR
jgi:hypothetical protein